MEPFPKTSQYHQNIQKAWRYHGNFGGFFCYPYKKYWGGVLCTICTIYVRVAA